MAVLSKQIGILAFFILDVIFKLICKLPLTSDLWVSSTRGLTQTEVWTKHLQLIHVIKIPFYDLIIKA